MGGDDPEKDQLLRRLLPRVPGQASLKKPSKVPKTPQMPSKQRVAGSNPARDATIHAYDSVNSSQMFTGQVLDAFLDSRAPGTSPKTFRIYHLALDRFIGYPLTPQGINAYLKALTCGNGKHNYSRWIRKLCRWLHHTDQLESNPIEKVLPPRRQKKLLPAISKEQLETLLTHCLCERDRVTLNLLWYSGMRLSEVSGVKTTDFNWDEGTVVVLGKGNRYRKALAGNGIVREWFRDHGSLEMDGEDSKTMLRRLGQATGIHCNAHSFRRGFCVHNVKSGLSNKVIQSLGGWESPSMVSHYAQSLTFEEALGLYRTANPDRLTGRK